MYVFVKKASDLLSLTCSIVCKADITQKNRLHRLESKFIFSKEVILFIHVNNTLAEKSPFCIIKISLSCFNVLIIFSCSLLSGHTIRIINFNNVSSLLPSIDAKKILNKSLLTFCESLYTIPKSMIPTLTLLLSLH